MSEGCLLFGEVKNSVVFPDVYIGKGASVKNSVVMTGVHIEDHAVIDHAIIGRKAVIKQGAMIASDQEIDGKPPIIVVAADMMIPPHSVIKQSVSCPEDEGLCQKGADHHE